MKWQLRLAASARQEIAGALALTLDRFGERQHDLYATLIAQALSDLTSDPVGVRAKARPELHPNARTLHIGRRGRNARHFFVYRINDDGTVDVARFLHDAMDLTRHLPESFKAGEE